MTRGGGGVGFRPSPPGAVGGCFCTPLFRVLTNPCCVCSPLVNSKHLHLFAHFLYPPRANATPLSCVLLRVWGVHGPFSCALLCGPDPGGGELRHPDGWPAAHPRWPICSQGFFIFKFGSPGRGGVGPDRAPPRKCVGGWVGPDPPSPKKTPVCTVWRLK